ncbi:hypothetical protein H6B11_15715 [Mediterraneibacter glycyrrhizinilyticus]|nr:hypothetical protein [Mediterraneibacter glycyrrhizinilyticus]MBM6855569.1 hypothetical protein [Mediterraneibacter glycyrrhizinilyticus]
MSGKKAVKKQKKTEKNRKKRQYLTAGIAGAALTAVLVVVAAVVIIFESKNTVRETEERYRLGDGVVIQEVSGYDGPFVEDGSDADVKDVWALTVTNTSDEDIQYLKIVAEGAENTGEFDITTLTAGSTVMVLEHSAETYPEDEQDCTYSIENLAYFSKPRSLYQELFTVSTADSWVKVENRGNTDATNDIYVYYKNLDEDDVFLGGITYRVKFEGGIPAGESREEQTVHYDPSSSEIMYLTYE